MKVFNFLSAAIFIFILLSCSKEEIVPNDLNFELQNKVLPIEEILAISNRIILFKEENSLLKNATIEDEIYIRELMMPLIENGQILYETIISEVNLNDPIWNNNEEDLILFDNVTEQHFVDLSISLSFVYANADIDHARVVGCIGVALGINELSGIINNTSQLMTTKGATKLVKLLLKRYVGWVGVAMGVYSFGTCMDAW